MITPILLFDSREKWYPVGVEESLALHGYEWHDGVDTFTKDKVPVKGLNFPKGMTQPDLPPVAYHRVVDKCNLYWHQFWFWYLYNPKNYLIAGEHEGDWEFIQLGCVDQGGNKPVIVTGSQHHTGAKKEFWRVSQGHIERGPRFYVALGSHAHYFASVGDTEDMADGRGKIIVNFEFREFGPWASWPGKWGNSTGVGKSPDSPGKQNIRWNAPHIFHGQSR
jgi:hypothetical protein